MATPNWIEADGLVNLRDVGGIPTTDGGRIAPDRLLRSDNLQDLSERDLALFAERGLTDVVDLRTGVEVRGEGPGPMSGVAGVTIHHHTLFIEDDVHPPESSTGPAPEPVTVGRDTDGQPGESVRSEALPWVGLESSEEHENPVSGHYLSYLKDRPDSVLAALRVIAGARGATLVHCAAGKDRTGTIVALALLIAGADEQAVVDDYAASSDRMEQIVARLIASPTYRENLIGRPMSSHLTHPETMQGVLDALHERGGVLAALAELGWTDEDTARMRAKLLG